MIHGEADVPLLMPRWQADILDGTCLTVLLFETYFVGALPFMERTTTHCLAIWTNQVIAIVGEVASEYHAVLLLSVDRDVGRDVPCFQQPPLASLRPNRCP